MTNPALTVAIALAAGMMAQSLAHHLRIPGIVLLLATGVLLGPDVSNIVQPAVLESGLTIMVGFAVAVILFEGGMNLRIDRIRRESRTIWLLLTLGALVSAIGGTLAAKTFLDWDWKISALFGTLVIVTGPTVVTPLLRRIKVRHSVGTVLEAEGVFLDAIGAIVAVVALEVALSTTGESFSEGILHVVFRIGTGTLFGMVGGFTLVSLLRFRNLVPEGLENVFTLSLVFVLYFTANELQPESGLVAVTVAGLMVGNSRTVVDRELKEFKEQLTVMLIGMLFVLLAADVRIADILSLGMRGIFTVAALILLVRPLNIAAGTFGSELTMREKFFLAWVAPRGIVAAAIASLFAIELSAQGIPAASEFRAMVFLVIAVTVILAGLTGDTVAGWLGVKRPSDFGWVIFGINEIGLKLGEIIRESGQEVICIDQNPIACRLAEEKNHHVIYANALEERTLLRAEIDTRLGVVCLTSNEEVNFLFAQKAKEEGRVSHLNVNLKSGNDGVTLEMLHKLGATLLFGRTRDLEVWSVRLNQEDAELQIRELVDDSAGEPVLNDNTMDNLVLPFVCNQYEKVIPVNDSIKIKKNDRVTFLINLRRKKEVDEWFELNGWGVSTL
ncbi:MAG: cation:proton antiporter [SAR202 cluster bacterium]|nr:cation:proton antiporter [SAR202 cluster bacterium]